MVAKLPSRVPENQQTWAQEVNRVGPLPGNIYRLGVEGCNSASKISYEQYLLLRVLWKPRSAKGFKPADLLHMQIYEVAKEVLSNSELWKAYIGLIGRAYGESSTSMQQSGPFSLVHY